MHLPIAGRAQLQVIECDWVATVYNSTPITGSYAAMGHCSMATRENYIAVGELMQPRSSDKHRNTAIEPRYVAA